VTLARFLMSPPDYGSVSDQRAANGRVMACVKKAKTNNHTFPFDRVLEFYLESAANQHGRASVLFPVVVTCRSLRLKSGQCEGRLTREMAASAFYRARLRSHRRVKTVSGVSVVMGFGAR